MQSSSFTKNYFYELPEDIQAIIYKKIYKYSLSIISDKRDAIDNYNKLVEYIKTPIKNQAIWNIFLCNRRDIGDPYYKYFTYYADDETDFLRLNKSKMIRYDTKYSTIKYIDFSIYPIKDRIPAVNYNYIKNTFEQYIHIFLSLRRYNVYAKDDDNNNEYSNLKNVSLLNDKIRIEFRDTYVFRCYIDIYKNILETYNFIVCILEILTMFNNNIFPEYNEDYMNDLSDLRDWFKYNSFFSGFLINDCGDTISPSFYLCLHP